MVNLTVNGQPVAVPEGTVLLEAVRTAGVDLPSLCYHKALSPYGACRLCMVAITAPREAIVASCTYPAEEGLVVETHAPEAIARPASDTGVSPEPLSTVRRNTGVIQEMAAMEEVTSSRFGASLRSGPMSCAFCVAYACVSAVT